MRITSDPSNQQLSVGLPRIFGPLFDMDGYLLGRNCNLIDPAHCASTSAAVPPTWQLIRSCEADAVLLDLGRELYEVSIARAVRNLPWDETAIVDQFELWATVGRMFPDGRQGRPWTIDAACAD